MKQTVEEAAMNFANYESNNLDKLPFKTGAEWQKERAIEALSSVLDNWVHGGDADCVIAEFEEKMNETTKV